LTLVPVLERAGKIFGSVEVVSRRPDGTVCRSNYAAIHQRSRALASALANSGLGDGDRVGSLMWNHASHLEAYFGVPGSGCVLHTINPRLHPDEIAYIVNHGGDRMLLIDEALLPVYERIRGRVNLERVVVVPSAGGGAPAGLEEYEAFLEQGSAGYEFPQLDENRAAIMC
jgi:fatty-acyl-CoA synthase